MQKKENKSYCPSKLFYFPLSFERLLDEESGNMDFSSSYTMWVSRLPYLLVYKTNPNITKNI